MPNTSPDPMTSPAALKARRVKFSYPTGSDRQHFVGGDLVFSHFIAVLSAMFPEGEDFFIRSVRHYRDQITDPALQAAIKGFIAQEATHRHQHGMLNNRLQDMGYPTARIDRHVKWLIATLERVFPSMMSLAGTAALEHYTASLAEIILTDNEMQALLGDSDVRAMLLWHAFEECEHKAVAFDVYRAAGGTESMRVRAMRIATLIFVTELVLQTIRSLAHDPASYHPLRLLRSVNKLRKSPIFTRDALRKYRSYNRPGFHPDDWDTTDVLALWSKELFDTAGSNRRTS